MQQSCHWEQAGENRKIETQIKKANAGWQALFQPTRGQNTGEICEILKMQQTKFVSFENTPQQKILSYELFHKLGLNLS